jgi:hypothetical protein
LVINGSSSMETGSAAAGLSFAAAGALNAAAAAPGASAAATAGLAGCAGRFAHALCAPAGSTAATGARRELSCRRLHNSAETSAPLLALSATNAAAPNHKARELPPLPLRARTSIAMGGGTDGGCSCFSRGNVASGETGGTYSGQFEPSA